MNRQNKQQGSLVIVAIVLMTVLGVIGVVMSKMYVSGNKASTEHVSGDKALNLAEAGTQSILAQLKANNCDPTLLSGATTTTSGGNTTTVVTQTIANQGSFSVTFQRSTGTTDPWSVISAASGSRRVTSFPGLSCASSGSGCYPIVGDKDLVVTSSTMNGTNVGACSGGDCNVVTSAGVQQNKTVTLSALPAFPTLTHADGNKTQANSPLGPGQYNDVTMTNNSSLVFNVSGGTYHIERLAPGQGPNITMAPGTYYIGRIDAGNTNNFTVNVNPSGVVKIYVKVADFKNNLTLNSGGSAGNLAVYGYTSLNAKNNGDITGVIYAPDVGTQVKLYDGGNAKLKGAIISGGQVNMDKVDVTFGSTESSAVTALVGSCGSGGGGGGGGGGTISPGSWKENF